MLKQIVLTKPPEKSNRVKGEKRMNLELEIVLLGCFKSDKYNKSYLQFAYVEKSGNNKMKKGLSVQTVNFNGFSLFEKYKEEHSLKQFTAIYHFEPTFQGQAKMAIDSIVDENGVDLLA